MADKLPDYFYSLVAAKVLVGDKPYPLVDFSVAYTLNEIPVATFGVALGRAAGTGAATISSAHGMLSSVKPFTPVEIQTKIDAKKGRRSPSSENDGLTGDYQTVFKGFLFTPTQKKSRAGSSATLTFQALGYPAALGGSTEVTTGLISTRVESGADIIAIQLGRTAAGTPALHNIGALIQSEGSKEQVDIFLLDMLFPKILQMINSYATVGATGTISAQAQVNTSALAELKRMRNYPLGTKPLRLDYGNTPKELSDKALARQYNDALNKRWKQEGKDLWTILKEFSNLMLFKVVPAIEHDALVPVTFGLNGEPWRKFEPSDYWDIDLTPDAFNREFYSYIGSVGLSIPDTYHSLHQDKLPIGVAVGFAVLQNLGVGSLDAKVAGRMISERTPTFLLCPGPAGVKSGLGGKPVPDAVNPDTAIPATSHGEDMRVWYGRDMGNNYAKTILYDRVFEHRQSTIGGRFRLDIAPGSLIRIRTIGDRFVGKDEVFFGHVLRVVLSCSAAGSLKTTFLIGSVRTESEHSLYTVPAHPLYKTRWAGAMLTD